MSWRYVAGSLPHQFIVFTQGLPGHQRSPPFPSRTLQWVVAQPQEAVEGVGVIREERGEEGRVDGGRGKAWRTTWVTYTMWSRGHRRALPAAVENPLSGLPWRGRRQVGQP